MSSRYHEYKEKIIQKSDDDLEVALEIYSGYIILNIDLYS